jgi:hypothetical protein
MILRPYVIDMPIAKIETRFEPMSLKANVKNEATINLSVKLTEGSGTYWCECDIIVKPPLSLAYDKELNIGRTRVGILKPNQKLEKQIKLYTRPNNIPDNYPVLVTLYLYDEDGAIAERMETSEPIKCEV